MPKFIMKKENNLYNYSLPKSCNEETSFFLSKGRITTASFYKRVLLCCCIYLLSYLAFYYGNFEDNIFGFVATLHLYIFPFTLSLFILIQGAKRMHDVNKSGWFFFIPLYSVYLTFCKGTIGNNDYGIDPKPMPKITYFDELENNQVIFAEKDTAKTSNIMADTKEKYYKASGKINFIQYIVVVLCAVALCYLIGLLYGYLSDIFTSFIWQKILKLNLNNHTNRLNFIIAKTVTLPKGYLILIVVLFIFFLPSIISIVLILIVIFSVREIGQSRNKVLDTAISMSLAIICLMVSNKYEINTMGHYIELSIFLLLMLLMALGTTNYFCEKCMKSYTEYSFYKTSALEANKYLESIIKGRINLKEGYSEKAILEKERIENLYYIELNKCDGCGSEIIKIQSKIVAVESDGNKKIKDDKTIVENLIIV